MSTEPTAPLAPEKLAEIEARHRAATDGPWHWSHETTLEGRAGDEYYRYDTEVLDIDHDHGCACRRDCQLNVTISDADRAALAHSWADIETLLAENARLSGLSGTLDAIRALVNQLDGSGLQSDLLDLLNATQTTPQPLARTTA